MPQIIVTADHGQTIMHRERVNVTDFESDHFAAQLVERIGWAVSDAAEADGRPTAEADERPTHRADIEARDRRGLREPAGVA